jgi:hypothetical protein
MQRDAMKRMTALMERPVEKLADCIEMREFPLEDWDMALFRWDSAELTSCCRWNLWRSVVAEASLSILSSNGLVFVPPMMEPKMDE